MTTSQMHGRARVQKTTTELVRGERIELCNGLLRTIGAIRHTGVRERPQGRHLGNLVPGTGHQ